jgi:hypothetical protein
VLNDVRAAPFFDGSNARDLHPQTTAMKAQMMPVSN